MMPSAVIPAVEQADLAPQAPPASPDSAGRFGRFGGPGAVDGFGVADTGIVSTPDRSAPMPVAPVEGSHLVVTGDSWWTLAERAYGDGRLYRALYAWNRTLDPRVALLPGTRLDIPPVERLTAAWPGLVPTRP
jgi:5'-nucleotidase